jgi:hypothetical protein
MGSLLNDKYLFVHINKSAGGVITNNMSANGVTKITGYHRPLKKCLSIAEGLGVDISKLYIFTAVRNPWDRMLSMYLFYKSNQCFSPEFYSGAPAVDGSFTNWIKYIYSDKFNRQLIHSDVNIFNYCFSNQLNWMKDDSGRMLQVDKILRHEEMNETLEPFLRNILKLKNINLSRVHPTKHTHYSDYYDTESKILVAEHYQEDIEYFKYKY